MDLLQRWMCCNLRDNQYFEPSNFDFEPIKFAVIGGLYYLESGAKIALLLLPVSTMRPSWPSALDCPPPRLRDPHLGDLDQLAAGLHALGHHPRCRGAIRRIRFPVSNFAQTAIDQWGIKIRGA